MKLQLVLAYLGLCVLFYFVTELIEDSMLWLTIIKPIVSSQTPILHVVSKVLPSCGIENYHNGLQFKHATLITEVETIQTHRLDTIFVDGTNTMFQFNPL